MGYRYVIFIARAALWRHLTGLRRGGSAALPSRIFFAAFKPSAAVTPKGSLLPVPVQGLTARLQTIFTECRALHASQSPISHMPASDIASLVDPCKGGLSLGLVMWMFVWAQLQEQPF